MKSTEATSNNATRQSNDQDSDTSKLYSRERDRLLKVLGELTEGGVVEAAAHIGATSVPDLPSGGYIDIALSIWPFPLDPHRRAALEGLGYRAVIGRDDAAEQRFQDEAGIYQVFLAEAGSELWTDYRLVREYLSHEPEARRAYSVRKVGQGSVMAAPVPSGDTASARLLAGTVDAARRWSVAHHGFAPVEAVVRDIEGLAVPWYIAGGWSVDLFLGRVTRVHHDVDVTMAREHQLVLQSYMTERGWKWVTPLDGKLERWPPQMRIELPRHQAHAHRAGAFIDFPLSEIHDGVWRFRRNMSVVRALEHFACRTASGIPYLAPEIVLLFKSKGSGASRLKDQDDFANLHASLEPERRAWLSWALTVMDQEHPWIGQLAQRNKDSERCNILSVE